MKNSHVILIGLVAAMTSCLTKVKEPIPTEDAKRPSKEMHLFMDVHNLEPGEVTFDAVTGAHEKDVAIQGKYDVRFLKYWVDETAGKVYCLAESADSLSIYQAHKEAHGLVPDLVRQVTSGDEASIKSNGPLFFDIHRLGPGKVTAKDVAGAHAKDLAVQDKYNVNLLNYWVDEKLGIVMCVAEAPDAKALINTHKDAHGLIPDEVHLVKEGH